MRNIHFCHSSPYFQCVEKGVRGFVYSDYSFQPHEHEFIEINIVLAGKGVHILEGKRFSVRAGAVFVIPTGTVHAYENESGLQVYHLVLHQNFFQTYLRERLNDPYLTLLTEVEPILRKNGTELFLRLTSAELLTVRSDLEILKDGGEYDRAGAHELKRYTVLKLLYYWAHLLSVRKTRTKNGKEEEILMDALEYIHRNYAEKITIQSICEAIYCTRSSLLRYFKKACGCSPTEYLRRYRVRLACEWIERGDMKKTEIAHACGFYDLSHMERELRGGKA